MELKHDIELTIDVGLFWIPGIHEWNEKISILIYIQIWLKNRKYWKILCTKPNHMKFTLLDYAYFGSVCNEQSSNWNLLRLFHLAALIDSFPKVIHVQLPVTRKNIFQGFVDSLMNIHSLFQDYLIL